MIAVRRVALGAVVALGVSLTGATTANAGSTSSALSLTATVTSAISIAPITLPAITGPTSTSANVVLNLPTGDPFTITLAAGHSGSCTARSLSDGLGDTVAYNLYVDAAHTTVWCGGGTGAPLSGTGTGTNLSLPFFLVVTPSGQPAGVYTDALLATVSF